MLKAQFPFLHFPLMSSWTKKSSECQNVGRFLFVFCCSISFVAEPRQLVKNAFKMCIFQSNGEKMSLPEVLTGTVKTVQVSDATLMGMLQRRSLCSGINPSLVIEFDAFLSCHPADRARLCVTEYAFQWQVKKRRMGSNEGKRTLPRSLNPDETATLLSSFCYSDDANTTQMLHVWTAGLETHQGDEEWWR